MFSYIKEASSFSLYRKSQPLFSSFSWQGLRQIRYDGFIYKKSCIEIQKTN